MKRTLFAFIFLFPLHLFSQSDLGFAPMGAKWHYQTVGALPYVLGVTVYEVQNDTIINGKACSEIAIWTNLGGVVSANLKNPFYVHYDSNRVYWMNKNTGLFDLLYDFNAVVGDKWLLKLQCDSIYYPWTFSDTLEISVDSIYTMTQNSLNLKAMVLSGSAGTYSFQNFHVAERLGGLTYPFPSVEPCHNQATAGLEKELRCYEDTSLGLIQFNSFGGCTNIAISNLSNDKQANEIKIFPHPADKKIEIYNSEALSKIELKDISGTTLFFKDENTNRLKIDTSKIPSGLYLLSTISRSGVGQTQKVIIQH